MPITTDAPRHALTVDVEDWSRADASHGDTRQKARIDTVFQVGPSVPGHLFHSQPRPRWHACLGAETAIPNVRSRS